MAKVVIGADTETDDPLLKTAGYSWKYGQGKILCTSLYYENEDRTEVLAGLHNENCPFTKEQREKQNEIMISILKNPDVCLVGANIIYDIGWWCYEYNMSTFDVKCSFVDCLQAESILNEFDHHSLEEVSQKYLRYGKSKDRIEDWVHENISTKGDFRKYLKDAPWDLLCEYVIGDAKNPVKIWRKQLTALKQQDLCARCKLEFDCILPILQITMNGYPIDNEQRKKNCEILQGYVDKFAKEFREKYNVPKFRVTASKDIASFCDARGIPYKCKITLTGMNGHAFADYKENDEACIKAKKLVSSFHFVKSKPVAFVPCELADRTCDLLREEGFIYNCSPNIDKKFFASQRDNYPEIALIADWKLAVGIISKILGSKYDRFLYTDKDGVTRTHGQFKITDTVSFRLSSNACNMQQIPSKGGFTVHEGDKEVEVSFPKLTRALFKANPNEVLWKIDYGQIEYRLICNIAVGEGSKEVREEFAKNPHLDFHQYVVDLTGLSRKYAKNMSFGVSFGMGLKSMAENFGWTMERAEEISSQYHQHMPFVVPTLALVGDVAKSRGYIKTVCGSHARLPNPNKSYTMLNRYTQGSGAEILKSSIVKAYRTGLWKKIGVTNTVHDELNGSVPPTEESMLNVYKMAELMKTTIPLNVPLDAEIELGDNWANTKEIKDWLKIRDNEPDEWDSLSKPLRQSILICEKLIKEGKVCGMI